MPTGIRERIGELIGQWWAPGVAAISRARRARMFHPEGLTFAGHCTPVAGTPFEAIGRALAGRVLARCSPALWRNGPELFDVLGIALRFRRGGGPVLDESPAVGDQDLLFATIRSPLTMVFAPFATNARDVAGNRYWAVSPFAAHQLGRFELRLTPIDPPKTKGSRTARLLAAVAAGRAAWWLEARRTLTLRWHRVARITLDHPISIDQAALRFDPFRSGGGLVPVGLVHAIRRATYAASQAARPRSSHRA